MFADLLSQYPPFPQNPHGSRPVFGLIRNRPHQDKAGAVFADGGHLLAIVEFDDQGLCYDRRQMQKISAVLDRLSGESPLILVFVHGWRHDARSDDDNLASFRNTLGQAVLDAPGRPVMGVFVGWRGLSWYGLGSDFLTFFTRKEAAFRVALGSARELLGRLRQFRHDGATRGREPVLIIIGHSFGGLLVYSAVAQSLIEAAATPPGRIVPSFADLVLLVNPAFEATRYLPVHQQIIERGFVAAQSPVFVSVTAKNDYATGIAFPIGMLWATRGELTLKRLHERQALLNTMGHIDRLITHEISAPGIAQRAKHQPRLKPRLRTGSDFVAAITTRGMARQATSGSGSAFTGGIELRARPGFPEHNPFWVVQASREVIDGHSGIFGEVFADFVRDLVIERLMAGRRPDPGSAAAD